MTTRAALRAWLRPACVAAITLTGAIAMALPMPPSTPAPKFKLEAASVYFNDALTRMFGSEAHVMRRNVTEWMHPETGPSTRALNGELVRGERDGYHVEKA